MHAHARPLGTMLTNESSPALTVRMCATCAGMPPASAAVGGLRRFFDISVPRNIAPDIGEGVGGRVFNVDDLKEVVSRNKEERRKAADEACVLLDQEQLAFEAWRDSLETVPTIKVRERPPSMSIHTGVRSLRSPDHVIAGHQAGW